MAKPRSPSTRILATIAALGSLLAQPTFPPSPPVDLAELLVNLSRQDVTVRLAAIRAVADHPDVFREPNLDTFLSALVPALVHEDSRLQQAAAAALFGRKGDYDQVPDPRRVGQIVARHLAARNGAAHSTASGPTDLQSVIRGTRSSESRKRALFTHLLSFHREDAACRRLGELIEKGPADLRWRAAWSLGRLWTKDDRLARILAAARDSEMPLLRAWSTFAHLKTDAVTRGTHRRLMRIVTGACIDLKALALTHLGWTRGIDKVTVLRMLCFVGDGCVPELRRHFVRAVGRIAAQTEQRIPAVRAFLVRGLSSPDMRARVGAIQGLVKCTDLRSDEITRVLAAIDGKPDRDDRQATTWYSMVAWNAANILNAQDYLPTEPMLRWLPDALHGEDWLCFTALDLARELGARGLPLRPRIKELAATMTPQYPHALAALISIGHWSEKDRDLLPILLRGLRSGKKSVHAAAVEALTTLGAPARPALRKLAADASSPIAATARNILNEIHRGSVLSDTSEQASLGHWKQASRRFAEASKGITLPVPWYDRHAITLLKSGAGFAELRTGLVARLGSRDMTFWRARHLTRTCALAPLDTVTLAAVRKWTKSAPATTDPFFQIAHCMCLYRIGRYQAAIRGMENYFAKRRNPVLRCFWMMAKHKLGATAEARRWLPRVQKLTLRNWKSYGRARFELIRTELVTLLAAK